MITEPETMDTSFLKISRGRDFEFPDFLYDTWLMVHTWWKIFSHITNEKLSRQAAYNEKICSRSTEFHKTGALVDDKRGPLCFLYEK